MARPAGLLVQQRHAPVIRELLGAWHFIRRWPVIPLAVIIMLGILGVFGNTLAPHDPYLGDIGERHLPPAWSEKGSSEHILGTDHAGRDLLSRIIIGARISLMVAAVSLISGFLLGTAIGLVSGYVGGIADEIITRVVDIWLALPFLMVALVVVLVFGQSLWVVLALLAMLSWVGFVRVVRAQTLQLKESDYVDLARVAGASHQRIMFRHLLPGIINTAVVIATLNVGGLILAEATLSFLGAGIPAPTPAWGVLVAEGRDYVSSAWWQTLFPGAAIFLVVMSLNFLGDWMRDRFDPRLRQLLE
jgi:peptide/nickel transport system permease protein